MLIFINLIKIVIKFQSNFCHLFIYEWISENVFFCIKICGNILYVNCYFDLWHMLWRERERERCTMMRERERERERERHNDEGARESEVIRTIKEKQVKRWMQGNSQNTSHSSWPKPKFKIECISNNQPDSRQLAETNSNEKSLKWKLNRKQGKKVCFPYA